MAPTSTKGGIFVIVQRNNAKNVYVAYDEDSFMGSLKVERCVEGLEVCRVQVEEEFRRRGVAGEMVRAVIFDHPGQVLVGYTNNDVMMNVFEKCGFKRKTNLAFYEFEGDK